MVTKGGLDEKALLDKMHDRFKRKKDQYGRHSMFYKFFNNALSFLLIMFQIALILITVIKVSLIFLELNDVIKHSNFLIKLHFIYVLREKMSVRRKPQKLGL